MLSRLSRRIGYMMILVLTACVFLSCAKRPYLEVDYKIIATSDQLTGKKIRIQVKDIRLNKNIFTPYAAASFPGFENRYRLINANASSKNILLGEQDLQGLFHDAFIIRLEKMGVTIVPMDDVKAPLFQVLIKTLKIDLRDRKWVTNVSFEGNLSMDNQLVARETVSGEAERLKILGSKGADDTFSDIFTEIINRLNIAKLFKQAKM